jgi:hypothetical protein
MLDVSVKQLNRAVDVSRNEHVVTILTLGEEDKL